MLTEVMAAMRVFLLILAIVFIAFGEAFLRISEKSGDNAFIKNYADAFVYAFRLGVGDAFSDPFNDSIQPVVLWIYFVLTLLIVNIVMLNLLIAIISEAFNKITENAEQAMYQERARIIAENGYLIPINKKIEFGGRGEYLAIANEQIEVEDSDQQKIFEKLALLNERFNEFVSICS